VLHRNFFPLALIILSGLFLLVKNDPFYGDAILSTSRAALLIYDNHLASFFYPADIDPGHPTFYPWLLAACWIMFGKSLFVAHAYGMVWSLFMVWCFRKLTSVCFDKSTSNLSTLLLLCFSTYLSVSALVLNTIPLMSFFLLAAYGLLQKNDRYFLIAASCMMLAHLQSSFFLLALAAADLYIYVIQEKTPVFTWFKKRFILYAVPLICFLSWLWIHYQQSGWFFHSPNYGDASAEKSALTYLKSFLIILWRLADYGMLPIHLVTLYVIIYKKTYARFASFYLISLSITILLMCFFLKDTIGHRYFLPFHFMAMMMAAGYCRTLPKNRSIILFSALAVSLVAGNFLYYPGKTIGDATLVYRDYFTLEMQIHEDFGDSISFYSYGPVSAPVDAKYVILNGLYVRHIDGEPLDSLPAILQSNTNAEFSEEDKKYLAEHFYGKSYENGYVYVNVFLNPKYYPEPVGWKLRESSGMEKWMLEIKDLVKK
jgi:hypothetical protein